MTGTRPPGTLSLAEALARYRPRTEAEAADVARLRALPPGADPWSRAEPLHATASALIVHPPTRRVLLRWHARQRAWLQVGGHADPGEHDPLAIALREGAEETGLTDLTPWPADDLVQVTVVPVPAAPHEPAHEHADLRFVFATGAPEAVTPENPEARLRWLPVDEALATATEPNVRELLSRVALLLDGPGGP